MPTFYQSKVEKLTQSPLIFDPIKQKPKTSFLSSQVFLFSSLIIAIAIAVIYAHCYLRNQIDSLRKETQEAERSLNQQTEDINLLTKTIDSVKTDIEQFEEKKKADEESLSYLNASIEKLRQEYEKVKESLENMNSKIELYEEEKASLLLEIERKKKNFLSVIH